MSLFLPKNELNLIWVGAKSDKDELSSILKDKKWNVQHSAAKSLSKKIKPELKYILILPLWAEGIEFISSDDWPDTSYVEVLLVRRSDALQELEHDLIISLINRFNVQGLLDWPLLPKAFFEIIKLRLEILEVESIKVDDKNDGDVIGFVRQLSKAVTVEELFSLLKEEIKSDKRVKPPQLVYFLSGKERMLYFQGHQMISKELSELWPQTLRIRNGNAQDKDFLSRSLGRPVLSTLSIPLVVHSSDEPGQPLTPANIYFEHSKNQEDLEHFMHFIGERLQPLTTALDRILLENDLKEAARTWSQTFDGIQDPVAIFDYEHRILRFNQSFYGIFLENRGQRETEENLWNVVDLSFKSSRPVYEQIRVNNKYFNVGMYPILIDEKSKHTTLVGHFTDVTESVQLQGQMIQNEKMVAVGHLAGNIAHELNNPLTGIRSLAQVLMTVESNNNQRLGDIKEIEHAAHRCQDIINNLLDFSKSEWKESLDLVSLNEIVDRTLPLLKTALRNHQCHLEKSDKEYEVLVELHLMQQVVFNLVNNACQAMGDSGELKISTGCKNGEGFLSIQDSGPGISLEDQEHIFESFFTTKKPGQGTGLGLSVSRKIVERFDGRIVLDSKPGEGAKFTIILPIKSAVDTK